MKTRMKLAWRRAPSGAVRRLRALTAADMGRGVIALLMAGGIVVALLVLGEVRHLSRAADEARDERLTAEATAELAAANYNEISSQIRLVLAEMDSAEISSEETAAEFLRRQDEVLDRARATEREVAALRAKVEALIAIEEARRETQLRFEKWLERTEAETSPGTDGR